MTTTRPARKAAPAAEVPAVEPAATEVPETPGAAEPDAAAPGSGQDGAEHEPALDEAEPYDFAAHARRVLFTPWPADADAPVIFAPEMRAEWSDIAATAARELDAAHAEAAAAEAAGSKRVHDRLDAYLLMRTERFPAHVVTA